MRMKGRSKKKSDNVWSCSRMCEDESRQQETIRRRCIFSEKRLFFRVSRLSYWLSFLDLLVFQQTDKQRKFKAMKEAINRLEREAVQASKTWTPSSATTSTARTTNPPMANSSPSSRTSCWWRSRGKRRGKWSLLEAWSFFLKEKGPKRTLRRIFFSLPCPESFLKLFF